MIEKKPNILLLAIEPPRKDGLGGEKRTYYFTKALSEYGEVTFALLSPNGERLPDSDIYKSCEKVVLSSERPLAQRKHSFKSSSWKNWLYAIGLLVMPWRNNWSDFLAYVHFFCSPSKKEVAELKWTRKALSSVLWLEFHFISKFFDFPSFLEDQYREPFNRIKNELIECAKRKCFDVIWVEHSFLYSIVEELRAALGYPCIVCNAHNVQFHIYEHYAKLAKTTGERQFWKAQKKLTKKSEAKIFNMCDLNIVCSEPDEKSVLEVVPDVRTMVIGNGVDVENFRPERDRKLSIKPTVLFTGTFSYIPNADAVSCFINEILPLVKNKVPECRFVVAGYMAKKVLDETGVNDDAVVCVSDPEDIRPVFNEAWVFVVPLRIGGGTRLKILEAMAMEVPVVSTRIGAEGVPYRDGENILLADTPAEFAEAVVQLLTQKCSREQLVSSAAEFVRANYDWGDLCDKGIRQLQKLIDVGKGGLKNE